MEHLKQIAINNINYRLQNLFTDHFLEFKNLLGASTSFISGGYINETILGMNSKEDINIYIQYQEDSRSNFLFKTIFERDAYRYKHGISISNFLARHNYHYTQIYNDNDIFYPYELRIIKYVDQNSASNQIIKIIYTDVENIIKCDAFKTRYWYKDNNDNISLFIKN
jgi:hypothetical protein